MADIELVIKIPQETYAHLLNGGNIGASLMIENALKEGTPLPKGHGRLIDVNELLDDIGLEDNDYNRDCNMGEIITLENIDRIPTIVETDEEE